MRRSTRTKKKTMEAVARHETIKRQQALKERPFRSLLYRGRKAVTAAQREKER